MVRVSASVAASRGSRCLGVVSASRHKLDRPLASGFAPFPPARKSYNSSLAKHVLTLTVALALTLAITVTLSLTLALTLTF